MAKVNPIETNGATEEGPREESSLIHCSEHPVVADEELAGKSMEDLYREWSQQFGAFMLVVLEMAKNIDERQVKLRLQLEEELSHRKEMNKALADEMERYQDCIGAFFNKTRGPE
mmetsp:Transcript_20049/g.31410  ORF Transcript_20049/g.31410 Transcript_20049/m.31410 type:complete len:115 (-) Transcript_20049:78-422(-)